MSFEENIKDYKAMCEGCPEYNICPDYIQPDSIQCKITLEYWKQKSEVNDESNTD